MKASFAIATSSIASSFRSSSSSSIALPPCSCPRSLSSPSIFASSRFLSSFPLLSRRVSPQISPRFASFPSRRTIFAMAVATETVEVLVKAAVGQPETLGDCPFSQRVLLTLEEKGVPYEVKYVDLANKPDWFVEVNPEGKVPVIKHEGEWVPDSDVITQILEKKYPEPPLETPAHKAAIGSKIFPSFVKFLKSKDPSDGTEQALLGELQALNDYLKDNGPFINGEEISAADLALAPKLFHLKTALGHYKKWSLPDDLTYVHGYMKALFSRESFGKTKPAEEHVIAGWQKHVA